MKKLLILLACLSIPAFAVSPAVCYAVTSGSWNTPSIWASTVGGAGGSCAATGGAGLVVEGMTATILAGVPGAAGLFDKAVINTGITVHLTAGVGVKLGKDSYPSGGDGVTVNATDQNTYGVLTVDAHALLYLQGSSAAAGSNYAIVNRYAVLQVAPGGWMFFKGTGSPGVSVAGRFYVGCGDQTLYPSPACAGNAGAWVSASVASTLNFTAVTSLPTGLAVSDLVELDPIPQRTAWAYPYTGIDGTTPPPAPPIMPLTDDTGTSPMQTCGSAANCAVPKSTQLCVVAISGSSVSLGWPQGGTTAQPYCTGVETAMNIINAGKGRLWFKKPAYLWGDPADFTWATSRTTSPNALAGAFDATRSALVVPSGPIANAAGTGPGRKGDASLSFSAGINGGNPCPFNTLSDVVSSGCYFDYDLGVLYNYSYNGTFTGTVTYKTISASTITNGSILIPANSWTYNELVIENVDLRYINMGWSDTVIRFSRLPNTANNHLAFRHNTVRLSAGLLGMYGLAPTNPIEVTDNAVYNTQSTDATGAAVRTVTSSSGVDVSHNYFAGSPSPIQCGSASGSTSFFTSANWTVTNNISVLSLIGNDGPQCQWPGLLIQQNRITGIGWATAGPGWGSYVALASLHNVDAAHPITIQNNYIYGVMRGVFLSQNTILRHNLVVDARHHMLSTGSANAARGNISNNLTIDHNIFLHYDSGVQSVDCIELGSLEWMLIDNANIHHNTCLGMSGSGVGIGDLGDSNAISLIAGLRVTDNILGSWSSSGPGFSKRQGVTSGSSPALIQSQFSLVGYNSGMGTSPMTKGIPGGDGNNIPIPQYNRNVWVAHSGNTPYNTDATRHATGVAIQNPSYASNKSGAALQFTYTSGSNMTLAWSLNGTDYGTPVQLNWAGAGVTYTVASATDPGAVWQYETVAVGGTPFGVTPAGATGYMPTTCPAARWALFLTGAAAGQAYAIGGCPSTSSLKIIPRPTVTITANDTFAVISTEVQLFDVGGTDYVIAGIDARSLPAATPAADTGINLALTDYCSSGCAGASVVSGLSTAVTPGVSNSPLIMVPPPWDGGSAEAAFHSTFYLPTTGAWNKSSTGGFIGAVQPCQSAGGGITAGCNGVQ